MNVGPRARGGPLRWYRCFGAALLGLTLSWSAGAGAAEFYVELPPQSTKAEAERQLAATGVEGARVARRYVRGVGWSYAVVVEGLSDLDRARATAGRLATAEQPATIYARDGREISEVETVASAAEAEQRVDSGPERRRRRGADDGAEDVLDAAVRAHGGRSGGLERLSEAAAIRFVYERRVPADGGTLVAHNVFLRQADNARLEVRIKDGQGQDSVTVVRPDGKAWVVVGGAVTDRDAARAREVLERFSPETVLAVPLGLPDDVETAEAWRNLRLSGTALEDGGNRKVLEPAEKGRGGLVSAAFDANQHTLTRVTWSAEAGQLTFRYDDYRRLDKHLVVPFHARVERDGVLIEEVRIQELVLEAPVDAQLFAPPTNPG